MEIKRFESGGERSGGAISPRSSRNRKINSCKEMEHGVERNRREKEVSTGTARKRYRKSSPAIRMRGELFPRSIDRGPIEAMPVVQAHGCATNQFPRSIDRGPIEAGSGAMRMCQKRSFPRSIDRGPIEARIGRANRWSCTAFPRSIDRGPIEAGTTRPETGPSSDFRGRSTAAPLKRSLRPACTRNHSIFPRSIDRGPIEATIRCRVTSSSRRISAVDRPRPH